MKHLTPRFLLLWCLVLIACPVWASGPAEKKTVTVQDKSPAASVASAISTVTGIAVSPLLGTGAFGAYKYFTATTPEQKASLPWFAQLSFWLPALAIVGACAAKDSLGAVIPPGLKKPLDVLETVENKVSGLVAAGAVVPFTMNAISKLIVAHSGPPELLSTGLASIHLAAIDLSWLLNLLTIPFGVAMFAVVWMASHAINVLILISPWGAVDAALKTIRTALLGLLTLTATLNPWLGAALSVLVIIVAYLVAGWAFRLTVFGSIFCWDFFTIRKRRFEPEAGSNLVFSGGKLKQVGVPVRTYGKLINISGAKKWCFVYRPWVIGNEKSVEVVTNSPEIGRGLFFSTVREKDGALFLLPPRYRGHEERMVILYEVESGVRDAGLLKAWSVLKEMFGTAAPKPNAARTG